MRFRKKVPLIQSKADNYIPTNEEVIGAYSLKSRISYLDHFQASHLFRS